MSCFLKFSQRKNNRVVKKQKYKNKCSHHVLAQFCSTNSSDSRQNSFITSHRFCKLEIVFLYVSDRRTNISSKSDYLTNCEITCRARPWHAARSVNCVSALNRNVTLKKKKKKSRTITRFTSRVWEHRNVFQSVSFHEKNNRFQTKQTLIHTESIVEGVDGSENYYSWTRRWNDFRLISGIKLEIKCICTCNRTLTDRPSI